MAKFALCINLADAPQEVVESYVQVGLGTVGALIPIPDSFWDIKTELVDRADCETDETRLQLLPYIRLRTEDGRTFRYTRGGGGEESRLHGNYSIGIGGHVDVHPGNGSLVTMLQLEANREALEEVGIDIPTHMLMPTHFICDPTNPVGRVHLGLLITYTLTAEQEKVILDKTEAGTIENAGLFTLHEVRGILSYSRMENWSKLIVGALEKEAGFRLDTQSESEEVSSSDTRAVGMSAAFALPYGKAKDAPDPLQEAAAESVASESPDDEDDGQCYECDKELEDCECEVDADADLDDDEEDEVASADRIEDCEDSWKNSDIDKKED